MHQAKLWKEMNTRWQSMTLLWLTGRKRHATCLSSALFKRSTLYDSWLWQVWGLLSADTVRDRTVSPLFWASSVTGCFWQYFYTCSTKLGGRHTSCWLMHVFRMDLSLQKKETWKNRITVFVNPADGIAQASVFEFCMKKSHIWIKIIQAKVKKLLTVGVFCFLVYFFLDSATLSNCI